MRPLHEQSDNKVANRKKKSLFYKCCWQNWVPTCKIYSVTIIIHHTQKSAKWINDLNLRPEAVKFLEKNIVEKIHHIAHE